MIIKLCTSGAQTSADVLCKHTNFIRHHNLNLYNDFKMTSTLFPQNLEQKALEVQTSNFTRLKQLKLILIITNYLRLLRVV